MRARVGALLGGRRSLRQRVGRLAFVGLLVLAAQLGAQLVAGRGAQTSGIEAMQLQAVRERVAMLAGALDAERSSLLLYRTTGEERYAAAHATALANQRRLLSQLDGDAAGAREVSAARTAAARIAEWESWSQDQMAGSGPLTAGDLVAGETRYQAVRSALQALAQAAAAESSAALGGAQQAGVIAFVTSLAGSLLAGAVLVLLAVRIVKLGVEPVVRLAATARRIAHGELASIEASGSEEVSELALALRAWQQAAAERAVVAEQAPTGIVRLDKGGRIVRVNRAIEVMHRLTADRLRGRHIAEIVHPADRTRTRQLLAELDSGQRSSASLEARGLRGDGTSVWCSITVGRLLSAEGSPDGSVGVIEDISERKLQSERASQIQRELWPSKPPLLDGYDVAGRCLPAYEVAGDLYDWVVTQDGHLEITVADVMGKGIGAALVAAVLRTALRAAPGGLGPAAKLLLASHSMTLGRYDDATFVTVFHARLDPDTGVLRYVDAGHGYCHVMRRGEDLVRMPVRSLPLGVMPDQGFQEGSVRLEPGDTLVIYSDGLVEQPDVPTSGLVADDVRDAADAADLVHRLLDRMPAHLADDVTALALRRTEHRQSATVGATRALDRVSGRAARRR